MEATLNNIASIIRDSSLIARGRSISKRKTRDANKPSASWISESRIGSDLGKSLAIVLNTLGCSHARSDSGGCTMCSYLLDGSNSEITSSQLQQQFDHGYSALEGLEPPLSIKIYTSGSFLDVEEVPIESRDYMLKRIADDDRIKEVVLESRPEYITEGVVKRLRSILGEKRIELGVGLESINETVRQLCINKGFNNEDFVKSVEIARGENIGIRAYVLLKPPFLTERDAILDTKETIQRAVELGVTTISINPVNVQKMTLVEYLWKRDLYRPAWLWSLVEILLESRENIVPSVNIVCDPVAGGKIRGIHNCGSCDKEILQAIREFSISQNPSKLSTLSCDCHDSWQHTLIHDDVTLQSNRDLTIDY
jgi:radical SAM enzyme (TIGR01210 family)